ncbi:MAG: CCC motif membrane protein [Luteibaculum sp.]
MSELQENTGRTQNSVSTLPNSTAVLVLGICSIALCSCYGLIGLICGIVALVLSKKAKALYQESPDAYTIGSYKNMNAGRICAIIGLCISAMYLIYLVVVLVFYGAMLSGMPWEEIMNQ